MFGFERLPLKLESGYYIKYNKIYLEELKRELEEFVIQDNFMNNKTFAKKVMFTHEIKANNTIEGINDSVALIEKVIEDAKQVSDIDRRNRIINLYNGYRYILNGKEINEKNVSRLYKILSKDLLDSYNISHMGDLYREAKVYILQNGRLDYTMDEGIDFHRIPEFMNYYYEYVNNGERFDLETDYFIKSQIMHFYFVCIHPYFDINGRTSRTCAMWYLLNNKVYPYIIFNRGINFDPTYDRIIKECKDRHEVTKFIKYMLITVKKELEKEYVVHNLALDSNREWKTIDYQTLEYLLSMNGNMSILDFASFYNRFNDYKRPKEILETMLSPLIEDDTLEIERETKKNIYDNQPNLILSLNKKKLDSFDTSKITRINL